MHAGQSFVSTYIELERYAHKNYRKGKSKDIYHATITRQRVRDILDMEGPSWRNIRLKCITHKQRNFNWDAAHRILPTVDWSHAHLAVPSDTCVLCELRTETPACFYSMRYNNTKSCQTYGRMCRQY